MVDEVYESFLEHQYQDAMALAGESDLLDLMPLGDRAPQRYVARFGCKGLVRQKGGAIQEANHHEVGIWFPPEYLRHADPFQVLTWLGPAHVFHPNISDKAPYICIGRLVPGTDLVDILYQVFQVITYQKVTVREDDALNRDACAWARNNMDRFPIDTRPLKRSKIDLQVELTQGSRVTS